MQPRAGCALGERKSRGPRHAGSERLAEGRYSEHVHVNRCSDANCHVSRSSVCRDSYSKCLGGKDQCDMTEGVVLY